MPDKKTSSLPKADHGLVCQHCGCRHFFVVYVRPARGNRVMRRRECRNCARRITTYESTGG